MELKLGEAFLKNAEQEVSATDFELQTLIKKLDYAKFVPVVQEALTQGAASLNMRAMLSLFQALKFPLTININHELKLRDIPSQIKIDAKLKSNNFFDPTQYELSFFYDFAKFESTELMASLIAISAAKSLGSSFKSIDEKTPEEIFMGSAHTRGKLSNVLFKLFFLKQDELMQHALGLGLLTDNEKTYLTKLKLNDGKYTLNSQEISKRELFRLPKTIAQKIIMNSQKEFDALLKEHDLVPRK